MIAVALLATLAAEPSLQLLLGADLALYRPGIDAGVSGATPYADLFGDGRGPLVGGYAGAAVTLTPDLTVALTLGLSHFGDSAQAFVDDGGDGQPARGEARSGGETSFAANPVSLLAGLRLTSLWTRLGVPLVPYVEGGGAYVPWSIGRGDGETAASGATPGLVVGAGLALELMGVERRAARTLEREVGVGSVLLRAGVRRLWLDGFGASSALVLSDTAWTFGLELGLP